MIDSTKAPVSATRRYLTIALLAVFIIAAGYFLWVKELHKSSGSSASVPPVPIPAAAAKAHTKASTTTTIPGGIPISSRNPFAGS